MAVKIYDASASAFKDAPTPQIYDVSAKAYKDSTGLVYDRNKGAWDERWGSVNDVVYLNGVINEGLAGTIQNTAYGHNGYSSYNSGYTGEILTFQKNNDHMYILQQKYAGMGTLFFTKAINFSGYSKLTAVYESNATKETPAYLFVANRIQDNFTAIARGDFRQAEGNILEVDLKDCSGSYYLAITLGRSYSDSTVPYLKIKSIVLT